ncbi:MAG: ferrous iron transporter B [Clostridia bacterium]|nr:ferrous iron transporter B [Clostridia bacterium]
MPTYEKIIGLAGNPNVGKSTVFNELTGLHQHTGNWSGKTVGNASGEMEYDNSKYLIYDLPGTYSLYTNLAEEKVAQEFVCAKEYDVMVVVCDAVCLERNLSLVLQVLDITKNVIVCVNLIDEAEKKKIKIDLNKLSKILGVKVIGMSAINKIGIDELKECIEKFEKKEEEDKGKKFCEKDMQNFINRSEEICKEVVHFEKKDCNERDRKIDRILTNKLTGIPIMLLLLGLILWITIIGANYLSDILFDGLFFLGDKIEILLNNIGVPLMVVDALISGVYRVLAWVVAVMLPPMAIFFPLFTLLEDIGYLPRIAFNLDPIFKKCGACGKQALTMCMGFGCNACGVTGCRIINSTREKLIAILTNAFVPCNGRFPMLISIITMFFVGTSGGLLSSIYGVLILLGIILFGIFMTFLVSKILSKTILKGEPSSFILELPPYRKPQILKIITRSMLDRTLFVLGRAVCVAAPAGLVIWLLANITIGDATILTLCTQFLDSFARIIGLDGVILMAFILGLPANEIVVPIILMSYMATGEIVEMSNVIELKNILVQNGWTYVTALCTMIFSLMHWPCSTTCITIKKETGSWKWVFLAMLIPTLVGMGVCFIMSSIYRLM